VHRASPRVSVIITTYNREHLLSASVRSVLEQDFRDLELIIVDDGSTDRTREIAEAFNGRSRYFYQPNGGIGSARNTGIRLSKAPLVAFLDDDNLWVQDKLSRQVAVLDARPDVDVVYGHVEQFYDDEVDDYFRLRHPIKYRRGPAPTATAALIRRDAFERVGPFLTDIQNGVEIDWQLRAMEANLATTMLPNIVLLRRIHASNSSLTGDDGNRQRLLALKRSLDRRRNAGP
jgi:glycosyltransferase involved in cell wall biosynthesis